MQKNPEIFFEKLLFQKMNVAEMYIIKKFKLGTQSKLHEKEKIEPHGTCVINKIHIIHFKSPVNRKIQYNVVLLLKSD